MEGMPNQVIHPDLASTVEWLARLRDAQRDRITEFEDALRRIDRLITLLDGTAGEADVLDDVRLLLARGALNYQMPPALPDEPVPQEVVVGWAQAALWAVITAKWHAGFFGALRSIASLEVAQLASNAHAVLKKSNTQHVAMQLARSLVEERFETGILNLIDDMCSPQDGGAALLAVLTVRDGKPIESPHNPGVFLKLLLFAGIAAAEGVIGNRADQLVQALLEQLSGAVKQFATPPAAHGLNAEPLLIALPALNFRMQLVRVPAGEFLMGSDKTVDANAWNNELPQHWVYLDEYLIGKYPVTVAQFATFVAATGYRTEYERRNDDWTWQCPRGKGSDVRSKQQHPVTCVTWNDAVAFCEWLAKQTGSRVSLPTEAEWEKAARWDAAKRIARIWPWGNRFDARKANTNEGGMRDTTSVGTYSADGGDSPFGCADMAGNVWEWCADWYNADEYKHRAHTVLRNPAGPVSGTWRVMRGGSYANLVRVVRCAFRFSDQPNIRRDNGGFRVVVRSHSLASDL